MLSLVLCCHPPARRPLLAFPTRRSSDLLFVPPIQLLGASVSIVFLGVFGWFFLKSRKGIAMRAIADSQQVAMAMGINVERYFALAWAMTGVVSALGGVIWGSMLGVDVHLSLGGFKGFPVVIPSGLDSIPGPL